MQTLLPARPAALDERQPLGQAAPALRHRRRRPRRARRVRASTPRRLTLEITETVLMADTDLAVAAARGAQGARRAARDGRLRHRLLVAELPQPLPGRHPQDGPLVPARRRVADRRRRWPPRSSRSARRCSSRSSPRASSSPSSGTTLRELGCELGQGFYFARPMDADATLEFLRDRTRAGSRRSPAPMHHSYEGLDRPGGFSRVRLLAPLRHRDFRLLWSGMCVSLLGDGVFIVAMAWQVYALSNAPTALVAGRHRDDRADDRASCCSAACVSDRFDRRRLMLAADLARGAGGRRAWRVLSLDRRARAVAHGRARRRLRRRRGVLRPGVRRDRARGAAGRRARAGQLARPVRAPDRAAPRRPGARRRAHRRASASARRSRSTRASFVVSAAAVLRDARRAPTARAREPARSAGDIRAGLALRPPPRRGCGRRSPSAAIAYLLFMGPAEVLLPFVVKNDLGGSAADLGLVFAAGGIGSVGCAVAHRPARAAAARHHVHVRRVDARDARGRRLRAGDRGVAAHARQPRRSTRSRPRARSCGRPPSSATCRPRCSAASRASTG